MTFQQTWLPFLYLYGVGGIAFFLGLGLIIRTKALRSSFYEHKIWLGILLYGFFFYMAIHAIFIYLAMST
ncbi:MAG: hypothetical protein CMG08_00465 [Candidatus Marinimicrobia bacterium]|nr:hypothetical protein [Candidatus Neomarinimicrobiota bacterium]|tara:strand:- start:680 stop:889 length:210 start_codon:yes stop_codon:yes gene_type:complete